MSIPNTIIIESNRQIANREAIQSITSSNTGDTEQIKKDFPNNRWTSHLQWGQQVKTGDNISLEAAMINDIGGSDSVMEFIGKTGINYDGGQNIDDSRTSFNLGFYVSNRYQFNFIYPKSTYQNKLNWMDFDYGGPLLDGEGYPESASKPDPTDISQFNTFRNAYPYEAIEGSFHDAKISRTYAPITAAGYVPTFMKPNGQYFNPSDQRFYIGQEVYTGPYFNPYTASADQNQVWDYYRNRVDFELPVGFSTPSAVQERLTAQLHQRNGPAKQWILNSVNASQFSISANGQIFEQAMPGVTDETYNTFSTSTGSMFYARTQFGTGGYRGWSCAFNGEKSGTTEVPKGTNYSAIQGNYQFWRQLLCAETGTWRGNGLWMVMTRMLGVTTDLPNLPRVNVPTPQQRLWTGPTSLKQYTHESITYNIGFLGCNTCIIDHLPFVNEQFYYMNSLTHVATDPLIENKLTAIWDLKAGDAITQNIYFTESNLQQIQQSLNAAEYLYGPIGTDDPRNQAYRDNVVSDFIIGKIDDENTLTAANRTIYLPNPFMIQATIDGAVYVGKMAGSGSPPAQPAPGEQGKSYTLDIKTIPYSTRSDPPSKAYPRIYGGLRDDGYGRMNVPIYNYGDPALKAEAAQANNLIKSNGVNIGRNLYPHNTDSMYQTAIPNGDITYLRGLYRMLNDIEGDSVGVIPVFLRPDQATGDNAKLINIPFVAVISKVSKGDSTNQNRYTYPLPSYGEFFGCGSAALTPNALGKIITTQKTQTDGYGQNANLDPNDYMPYIYTGSSDALINFDDGYSRFTISKFHTPVRPGNGTFQNIDQKENTQPEIDSMSVYEQEAALGTIGGDGNPVGYNSQTAIPRPQPVISTQGGISILDIILYLNVGKSLAQSPEIFLNDANRDKYTNSLFDKCGFSLEQLLPIWGLGNNEFNRGNYNKYLGSVSIDPYDKYLNMVKPFTTNAYISAAIIISLVQGIAVKSTESGVPATAAEGPVPTANLGALITKQSMTNADSDILVAVGMPQKLDYPYLVVYTDIVRNPLYYGGPDGRQKLSAIAYITRNYAEGDFFYSFSTGWTYTADQDYIITDITTDIRLPDGSPAPIDKNSSVIYKIQTTKAMPNPPAILQAVQQQQKIDEKLNKKSKRRNSK